MIKSLVLIATLILLTGCAGNQKFDCPHTGGVNCKSLAEVDNQISHSSSKEKAVKKLEPKRAPDSPLRTSEEVLTLWVAPYQTEDGTLHEEKIMHFVARPAQWAAAKELGE